MNAALAQAPQSYRTLVDAWSWTLFEGDSLLGTPPPLVEPELTLA